MVFSCYVCIIKLILINKWSFYNLNLCIFENWLSAPLPYPLMGMAFYYNCKDVIV